MTRIARIVVPGAAHHVTQRGNNRQDVFFVEDDKRVYPRLIGEQSQRFGLRIEGYCLMTSHVHLVAVPATEDALTLAVGRTHFLYTQYINRLHGRSGHLWQNRFFSCPMDEDHAVNALCYIELNPVRAGMVRVPWRYPWSSAAAHCGKTASDALLALTEWRETMPGERVILRKMRYPARRFWNLNGKGTSLAIARHGEGSKLAGPRCRTQPVGFVERVLQSEGGIGIFGCNARATASGFYQNMGWSIISERFNVPGVGPHYRMTKRLPG